MAEQQDAALNMLGQSLFSGDAYQQRQQRFNLASQALNMQMQTQQANNQVASAVRDNYEKYELYVDDFTIEMGGTTIDSILVNLNNSLQYNSYNSTTKGQNPTIATIFNPNQTGARTADLAL